MSGVGTISSDSRPSGFSSRGLSGDGTPSGSAIEGGSVATCLDGSHGTAGGAGDAATNDGHWQTAGKRGKSSAATSWTGELLTALLKPEWGKLTPKLVGMLIELDAEEQRSLLASRSVREAMVYEALMVLSVAGNPIALQHLLALPTLPGKPAATVIDAFLEGKTSEVRSPTQGVSVRSSDGTLTWSLLKDLPPGQHVVFVEPAADMSHSRRMLLRITGPHQEFRNRGLAVAQLREQAVPERLASGFSSPLPRCSAAWGASFYRDAFGCSADAPAMATPVSAVGWLPPSQGAPRQGRIRPQ